MKHQSFRDWQQVTQGRGDRTRSVSPVYELICWLSQFVNIWLPFMHRTLCYYCFEIHVLLKWIYLTFRNKIRQAFVECSYTTETPRHIISEVIVCQLYLADIVLSWNGLHGLNHTNLSFLTMYGMNKHFNKLAERLIIPVRFFTE